MTPPDRKQLAETVLKTLSWFSARIIDAGKVERIKASRDALDVLAEPCQCDGWIKESLEQHTDVALVQRVQAAEAEVAALRERLAEAERWKIRDRAMTDYFADASRRADEAERQLEQARDSCARLVLTWHCTTCGWETTMPVPGFGGDGYNHYPDGTHPCGPLIARRTLAAAEHPEQSA